MNAVNNASLNINSMTANTAKKVTGSNTFKSWHMSAFSTYKVRVKI